jgi:hypothetical protein
MGTIIKHSYIKAGGDGLARALAHVRYLQYRPGKDRTDKDQRTFFDAESDNRDKKSVVNAIKSQRTRGPLIHKLIISPGANDIGIEEYVREIMSDLGSRHGLDLEWYGMVHRNTDHPHCHVVLMGCDRSNARVFLRKSDYAKVRDLGDRYLERHRPLVDDWEEKERFAEWTQKLLSFISRTVRELVARDKDKPDNHALGRGRELERLSIGEPPDREMISRNRIQLADRLRREAEAKWQIYCTPIMVRDGVHTFQYTRTSPLESLRQLERAYCSGDHVLRRSLNERDFSRLQDWIRERVSHDRKLSASADKISSIELIYDDRDSMSLDCNASVEHLEQLKRWHDRGDIFLRDHERRAVDVWITQNHHDKTKNDSKQLRYKQPDGIEPGAQRELRPSEKPSRNKRWKKTKQRLPDK